MLGQGHHAPSALDGDRRRATTPAITDEFVEPVVIEGTPRIEPGDTAIFFNFRPDRARQLSRALLAAGVDLTTMTRYAARHRLPRDLRGAEGRPETLAEVLVEAGIRQLHVAETEKYAHVTYFFNGGRRGGVARGDADPRPEPARRPELRPQAGDVGRRGRRPLLRRGRQRLRLRARQLREPGHGRPHRRDPGRRQGGRDDRPLPRPGRGAGRRASAASASSPPTTATPSADRRRRVSPHTAHTTNQVPFVVTASGGSYETAERSPTSPPRCSRSSA